MVAAPKTASCAPAEATAVEHYSAEVSPLTSYDRHFQTHFTVLKPKAPRLTESSDLHTASISNGALSVTAAGTGPSSVQVLQGVLFIDGKPVTSTKSIKDDIFWTRPVEGQPSLLEHGMIHIYPNGLTGYGYITHTPADPPAAAAVPPPTDGHSALHTVSRPLKRPAELAPTFFKVSAFTSTWTTKVMGASGAWEEGPKLIMSAEGHRRHNMKLVMPDGSTLPTVSYVKYANGKFTLEIQVHPDVAALAIDLSDLLEAEKPAGDGTAGGQPAAAPAPTSAPVAAPAAPKGPFYRQFTAVIDRHGKLDGTLFMYDEDKEDYMDKTKPLKWTGSSQPSPMASMDWVKQAMIYHMDDAERQQYFGVVKPDMTAGYMSYKLGDNIKEDQKKFLRDRYSKAYLGKLIMGSGEKYTKDLTLEERVKLDFYLSCGNPADAASSNKDAKVLITEPAYNEINEIATIAAFAAMGSNKQVLTKYKDSTEGPLYWAKQLYDEMCSELLMTVQAPIQDQLDTMHKYCLTLLALTTTSVPKEQRYDTLLWNKMLELGLGNMQPYVQHTQEGQQTTEEWISKALEEVVKKLVAADATATSEIKHLQKTVSDLYDHYNIDKSKETLAKVKDFVESLKPAVGSLVKVTLQLKAPPLVKLRNWMKISEGEAWRTKLPKYAVKGVCALLSAAALGFGIYGLYQGVADWTQLNDVDKGELVVGGTSTIMEMLAMVGKTSTGFFAGSKLEAMILSDDFKVVMDTVREFNAARGNIFSLNALAKLRAPGEWQAGLSVNAARDLSRMRARWYTAAGSKIMGCFQVLLLVAFVGLETADLVSAIKAGDVRKITFDSLNIVATGLTVVGTIAGLVAADSALAILGPIGIVAGLVIMIVELATERDPPPPVDPLETYITNSLKPFLNNVPVQPYPGQPGKITVDVPKDATGSVKITVETAEYQRSQLSKLVVTILPANGDKPTGELQVDVDPGKAADGAAKLSASLPLLQASGSTSSTGGDSTAVPVGVVIGSSYQFRVAVQNKDNKASPSVQSDVVAVPTKA
eukprot:gene8605-8786_t